jgi:hypothetical protein
MRLAVFLALCTLVTATHPRSAGAKCARPTIAVAPADGSLVPPNPVFHLFVPKHLGTAVTARVAGKPVDLERVASNPAFVTFRGSAPASQGRVELAYRAGSVSKSITYRIDRGWKRPAGRVSLAQRERVEKEWTCSHTDTWSLEVSDAPAYRVEWATSKAAWEAGRRQTLIVPRRVEDFWLYTVPKTTTRGGQIGLGHLNCFEETISSKLLSGRLFVGVQALYPDGSASAAWVAPIQLGPSPRGP